jgi:hypothetical protein
MHVAVAATSTRLFCLPGDGIRIKAAMGKMRPAIEFQQHDRKQDMKFNQ